MSFFFWKQFCISLFGCFIISNLWSAVFRITVAVATTATAVWNNEIELEKDYTKKCPWELSQIFKKETRSLNNKLTLCIKENLSLSYDIILIRAVFDTRIASL